MNRSDVLVLGYVAVLDRLIVPDLPPYMADGCIGEKQIPALTVDAPIVGLALAQAGLCVDAILSNPGSSPAARAASDLIGSAVHTLREGPDRGTPLELIINTRDGRSMWLADPKPGLASLYSTGTAGFSTKWAYVDSFAWIDRAWLSANIPPFTDGLFINLGKQPPQLTPQQVGQWRGRTTGRLVVQVSFGPVDPSVALEIARSVTRFAPNLLFVATLGTNGLVIAHRDQQSYAPATPSPLPHELDSTGAGAAVSAALLQSLLVDPEADLEIVASILVCAGAAQCAVAGSLDQRSANLWRERILALEPNR